MMNKPRTVRRFGQPAAALLALLAAVLLPGCAQQVSVKNTSRTFRTVVIDAGHGGKDSGTCRRGVVEKNAALDVARRLEPKLRAAGFDTVMTRRDDRFVELNTRADISNRQNNAVFVSIHFNDARNRRIVGAETYYHHPSALRVARCIQRRLDGLTADRGIKKARFRVLRLNRYPAVLVECGFLSNGKEARMVKREAYREQLANNIAAGIVESRK